MKKDSSFSPDLLWAFRGYIIDSGRLLAIELDRQGRIAETNQAFRTRFNGFNHVQGEHLSHFLVGEGGSPLEIEPGLSPHRTPTAHALKGIDSDETYLFHAYPLDQGMLLIGEPTNAAESDIIERMGHLAMEMSRLVRDLRKTNHELVMANDLNERLARTDALTGLANRRYFMERLSTAIKHAQTRDRRLSLLMIDLDHFKKVNDRFGHAGGDAALLAFADLLKSQVRPADLPARFGGEEFILYLPDTDLRAARQTAERLRVQILDLRPINADYRISASFGVTELAAGEDAESFIKRADDLLYRAKTEGRNRVIAEPAPEK